MLQRVRRFFSRALKYYVAGEKSFDRRRNRLSTNKPTLQRGRPGNRLRSAHDVLLGQNMIGLRNAWSKAFKVGSQGHMKHFLLWCPFFGIARCAGWIPSVSSMCRRARKICEKKENTLTLSQKVSRTSMERAATSLIQKGKHVPH